MSDEALTVLLADDEPLALRRLRRLVHEVEDVRIVATAVDGDQALALARESAAQVVIIDIKMPGWTESAWPAPWRAQKDRW